MKRLIYNYLSSIYKVNGSRIQCINTKLTFGNNKHALVNDLKKVFGYTESELKWYIKGWIKKQNKGFDFNRYWNLSSFFSPTWSYVFACDLAGRPNSDGNVITMYYRPPTSIQHINVDITISPSQEGLIHDSREAHRLLNQQQPQSMSFRYEGRQPEEYEEQVRRAATYYENAQIVEKPETPSVTYSRPSGGW